MIRVTLGDVCEKASSNIAQKTLNGNEGKYPIFGASGFIKNVDFYQQEKPYIAIVKDGAGIGRTMLLPAKSSVLGTMQYILPKEYANVDLDYLYYAIVYMNLGKYFSGATIPHIYFKDYQKEPINWPEIQQQQQMSNILKKIDAIILSRRAQMEYLDELVKSRFVELFGDMESNPKGWKQSTLGDECYYIKDGPHKSPKYLDGTDGIPFISTRNVVNGDGIDWSTAKYISEVDYLECIKKCHPEKGDILYSKGGTTGIAKLVDTDICFANWVHVAVLKFGEQLDGRFLECMLNMDYCYTQSQALTKGIANRDFVLSSIAQVKIYVPPIELQKQYTEFVKQRDKSKLAVQKSLEELETLKKSLMQEYFG